MKNNIFRIKRLYTYNLSRLFFVLVTTIGIISSLFINTQLVKAASTNATNYGMKVLVLKYFPLTTNGLNINIAVTGDIGDTYANIHQKTIDIDNNLITDLAKGSTYLGYKTPSASPSLTYQIVDTKEFKQAVPFDSATRRPLYNQILTANNICSYVQAQGVSEVWFWAYQGPNKADGMPYLSISESKMSGPFGDISNSFRLNDMPQCGKTYRVYTFNYGVGTAEAIHSWGHQMESEIDAVNRPLFRKLWQGTADDTLGYSFYPQTLGVNGRCGSVHNPPNARFEYDYANPTPQNSDCLNWNADSIGTLSKISCQNWGCQDIGDSNNSQLNYLIWNYQNMPGRSNTKTYQGQPMRNWWDIHGNFDQIMGSDKTLLLNSNPTPTPTYPPVHISDTFNRTNSATSLTKADTGQTWSAAKGVWGISGNTAYSVTSCPAPAYAVVDAGTPDGKLHLTIPINHQDLRVSFRYYDLNNMYWIENTGSAYEIDKFAAGIRTTLISTSGVTPKNGDIIDLTLAGSSIKVNINNVLVMNTSDSSLTGTKYGIGTWCDTSMRFDNFTFDYSPPPTSMTFTPVADTYIALDNPTSTLGGTAAFLYTNGNATAKRQTFMRFNLASVVGKTITKAVLRVHTTSSGNAGSVYSEDVHYVDNNLWTEQTMSWNNTVSPSTILATPLGTLSNASQLNTSYDIPLTISNVQSHLGGLYSLQLATTHNDDFVIGSRESATAAQLILNF